MTKRKQLLLTISFVLALFFTHQKSGFAQQSQLCAVDINQDNVIDLSDYSILVANFLKTSLSNPRADINRDGIADISDYSLLVANFLQTVSCTGTSDGVVLNLSQSSGPYQRYKKIEWSFDLTTSYSNPYYYYDANDTPANNPSSMSWFGVDGVSVDMNLISPSGKTLNVPAFWMEDYLRVRNSNLEYLGKKDNGRWHVRFTPEEEGSYRYTISIADKAGTNSTNEQTFTVSGANGKGFVRTSSVDSRFLAYADGSSFVPIGSGAQWWENNGLRSYSYEDTFNTFGANNINFLRIWDQSDFALGVEGAQPVWLAHNTVFGPAVGVEINTANVHSGMRAARPAAGAYWYQRIAIAEPNKEHKLTAWVKTNSVSGGQARVQITNTSGTVIGQTTGVTGTTGWTEYSTTFVPGTQLAQIRLSFSGGSGTAYIDDISFGPTDSSGNVTYNIISDADIERHFAKDNPSNDPNSNPSLPRPLGTFFNPWSAYDLDKILESAEANNVKIQLCSCSGPWFTWPQNNDALDYTQAWVLKSWQRNFRYRVARWGYSPSVLAWEQYNERGHVTSGSAVYTFLQNYGNYQATTDPYKHLRTTSQNSQAYSPGMWSSSAMDISNYHDYLDFRGGVYNTLSNDEVLFIQRFAWCLTDTRGVSSPYCQGLGLGDGSTWSGPAKPWIWGEIGVFSGSEIQGGEAGKRFLHNIVWAGLFSPMGTTPLDWYQNVEDNIARVEKYASRKAASAFFNSFNYASARFSFLTSSADSPPGYTGEALSISDSNVRAYGMKSQDKKLVVVWATHRNNIWSKATSQFSTISPTISVPGVLNQTYTVEAWNTSTGQIISTQQVAAVGTTLHISTNLTADIALKIYTQ